MHVDAKTAGRGAMASRLLIAFFLFASYALPIIHADNSSAETGSSTDTAAASEQKNETKKRKPKIDPKLLNEDADWGTFYDPKDIFCGKFDCYKILGFDYRTFYTNRPTTKEITQNYRGLSRHWHPDKNQAKGAKNRFVKIARAYEVLTNKETRDEYDFYRDRPDEYFKKYGSSVLWTYAPKSNTASVIVGLLALLSCMTLWIKKHRWRTIADHIIKAASENRSVREGGSSESMAIREQAIEILELQEQEINGTTMEDDEAKTLNSGKRKKTKGLDKKEKKVLDQQTLKPIIVGLVEAIDDFGGGYAKPTWKDLFVVKLALFPLVIVSSMLWWTKYAFRRIRKLDYSDAETEYFTRHAVGDIIWATLSEKERMDSEKRELWIPQNHEEWLEEQELKLLSPKEQKLYAREKKREKRNGGKPDKED